MILHVALLYVPSAFSSSLKKYIFFLYKNSCCYIKQPHDKVWLVTFGTMQALYEYQCQENKINRQGCVTTIHEVKCTCILTKLTYNEPVVIKQWWSAVVQVLSGSDCAVLLQWQAVTACLNMVCLGILQRSACFFW